MRREREPRNPNPDSLSPGDPVVDPAGDSPLQRLVSRRELFKRYGLPVGGMAVGVVTGGVAVWNAVRLLGNSGEQAVLPAPEAHIAAEFLSDAQKQEISAQKEKALRLLEEKEGMGVRTSGEFPSVPGLRLTVLSHRDRIVEANVGGIASGLGALFAVSEDVEPSVYRDHLLRARDAISQGRFADSGAEIVLAYSGSSATFPSPRDTDPEDFSAFAPIPEGASFADLSDREPVQGFMESELAVVYGLNAGAIDGVSQRMLNGRVYDLSPEEALRAQTAHELGHAMLRFLGVNRDPGEEPYMRDVIEPRLIEYFRANPALPLPIRYPQE